MVLLVACKKEGRKNVTVFTSGSNSPSSSYSVCYDTLSFPQQLAYQEWEIDAVFRERYDFRDPAGSLAKDSIGVVTPIDMWPERGAFQKFIYKPDGPYFIDVWAGDTIFRFNNARNIIRASGDLYFTYFAINPTSTNNQRFDLKITFKDSTSAVVNTVSNWYVLKAGHSGESTTRDGFVYHISRKNIPECKL